MTNEEFRQLQWFAHRVPGAIGARDLEALQIMARAILELYRDEGYK